VQNKIFHEEFAPVRQCLATVLKVEESNLVQATRITDVYYELHLRPDLFTTRHCQAGLKSALVMTRKKKQFERIKSEFK
jgi:hypothetical protein